MGRKAPKGVLPAHVRNQMPSNGTFSIDGAFSVYFSCVKLPRWAINGQMQWELVLFACVIDIRLYISLFLLIFLLILLLGLKIRSCACTL